MAVEIISWPISTKECCRTWGLNPRLSTYQADAHPMELPHPATHDVAQLGHVKRIWYLMPMWAAKVQASLRIRADSPEPPLLAQTSSDSRGTFRQKAISLAPLNGWACTVKICHDRMLEDTNSLWHGSIKSVNQQTYPVKQLPSTGILQEDILYLPILPKPIELDYTFMT